LQSLFVKVGSFYPKQENFHLTPEVKATFTEKLEQIAPDFLDRKVRPVVRTDGLKLICEDGPWICCRLSGTEPVVRIYSEVGGEQEPEKLSTAAKPWIFEKSVSPESEFCQVRKKVCGLWSGTPPKPRPGRTEPWRGCAQP
jgi:phosphoglucomutase